MKTAFSIKVSAWFILLLNLLMATACIWMFVRMAPAIEVIIARNVTSLECCQNMLSALAVAEMGTEKNTQAENTFRQAFDTAMQNITENNEPAALAIIESNYEEAFDGNINALKQTIQGIQHLGDINRQAMVMADVKARQIGQAGAWVIVFMGAFVFFAGLIFIRRLSSFVIRPMEEMVSVIHSHKHGDTLRRCSGPNLPAEMMAVYKDMNEMLDRYQMSDNGASEKKQN